MILTAHLDKEFRKDNCVFLINSINELIKSLNKKGFVIELKGHPKDIYLEQIDKEIHCQIIDKNILAEELNLFSYSYIINYESSIVIDLLINKFPNDRIITIANHGKGRLSHIYNQTIIVKKISDIHAIKFEAK